jgi:hypothetical protein
MNRTSKPLYGEEGTKTVGTVSKLPVANGALLEAPILETHIRGTNYLAIVDVDGTMPGGLERRFCPRARGDCLYLIESIGVFDALEFAADYTTSVGKRKRIRWHGIVLAKTDNFLLVEESENGTKAVLRSREARCSPADRIRAIQVEREVLLERAAQLEEEAGQLGREEE